MRRFKFFSARASLALWWFCASCWRAGRPAPANLIGGAIPAKAIPTTSWTPTTGAGVMTRHLLYNRIVAKYPNSTGFGHPSAAAFTTTVTAGDTLNDRWEIAGSRAGRIQDGQHHSRLDRGLWLRRR